jgi:sterol desaturase/sphingolipid hydroxylase (fatty acid hydroxylase superfamily)
MRLSKTTYYVDFYVYPVVIAMLAAMLLAASHGETGIWLACFVAGLLAWTLIEYVMHRLVFHHMPLMQPMHETHHDEPTALIGTPVWVSGSVVLAMFVALWQGGGLTVASGTTAGLTAGYLWYISVHHAVHHWHPRHASYLYRAKRRHAQHHFSNETCNFGVTTAIWDRLFGTEFE